MHPPHKSAIATIEYQSALKKKQSEHININQNKST